MTPASLGGGASATSRGSAARCLALIASNAEQIFERLQPLLKAAVHALEGHGNGFFLARTGSFPGSNLLRRVAKLLRIP
jgi:hypothetical protein